MGITIRPPSRSCSTRAGGTFSGEQVTMILSKGASSGQPRNRRRPSRGRCRSAAASRSARRDGRAFPRSRSYRPRWPAAPARPPGNRCRCRFPAPCPGLGIERLGHVGHDERRRDGLGLADRQGHVHVRLLVAVLSATNSCRGVSRIARMTRGFLTPAATISSSTILFRQALESRLRQRQRGRYVADQR